MTPIQQILEHLTLAGIDVERVAATHSGIIVTVRVPPAQAAHLAVPDGEAPDEMHVTLAFLGKSDDLTPDDVARYGHYASELAALAARTPPLTLSVTGSGTFKGADDGGGDAHYLDVDGPGLRPLREEVMDMAERLGLKPSRKFPTFHPHVTLAYGAAGSDHPDAAPPALSLPVPCLELWMGGAHWKFPFRGGGVFSKADSGQSAAPPARAMLAQLTGDLLNITRSERTTRQRVSALATHHAQAADGLAAAIRAPRDSALEAAFLEHADDARAARALAGE